MRYVVGIEQVLSTLFMRIDKADFIKTIQALTHTKGGKAGPCLARTLVWAEKKQLPRKLIDLLRSHAPKTEVWAGAGALFDETQLVRWNDDFPEALTSNLLIVGRAGNGDHIGLDLLTGAVGYLSHEHDWQPTPRQFFIPVTRSLGFFLRKSNSARAALPGDYWEAKATLNMMD